MSSTLGETAETKSGLQLSNSIVNSVLKSNPEIKAGKGAAFSDAFILKPALWGVGIDLKELAKTWRAKSA